MKLILFPPFAEKLGGAVKSPGGGGGYSGFQVTGMIEWGQK